MILKMLNIEEKDRSMYHHVNMNTYEIVDDRIEQMEIESVEMDIDHFHDMLRERR